MKVNKEQLINPVKVKVINGYNYFFARIDKKQVYYRTNNMVKELTSSKENNGLGYNLAIELDSDNCNRILIFCEKEQKQEVLTEIKKHGF